MIDVVAFTTLTPAQCETAAQMVVDSFAHMSTAWKTIEEAREAVAELLANPEWTGFAAVEGATVLGWIGGIATYSHAWELHPLVVAPNSQRRGVGTLLVKTLEHAARASGILTLYLGSDDDFGGTTAFGADLYRDTGGALSDLSLTDNSPHPLAFYRQAGFTVVGFIPDANGNGKPDIWFAKRL
jgi:aminoglycoside 6'-N-acetyltransferase I